MSKYESKQLASKINSNGKVTMAEQILKMAKLHNINIKEDKNLLEALSKLELNDYMQVEAYECIANILLYIYKEKK